MWTQHDDVAMEPGACPLYEEESRQDKDGYNLKRNGNEDYEGNVAGDDDDDEDEDVEDEDGEEDVAVERLESNTSMIGPYQEMVIVCWMLLLLSGWVYARFWVQVEVPCSFAPM